MFELIVEEKEIGKVVTELDRHLTGEFVLWLKGEMGAGKTSLVRAFLRAKGLPSSTPVISPTYTIMNEYYVKPNWYAHLDLYRAEDSFSLDEIGVKDRSYEGIFMEWPETPGSEETIAPTHLLEIEYAEDGAMRKYKFSAI